MSEEKLNTVRNTIAELDYTIYQLSGVAEMLEDIIDVMPFRKTEEDDPTECLHFCIWAQKRLNILVNQLMLQLDKGGELVTTLEEEFSSQ